MSQSFNELTSCAIQCIYRADGIRWRILVCTPLPTGVPGHDKSTVIALANQLLTGFELA